MDEIRDQMAISSEISEAIARPALGNEIDEDELREELEALEQEELDNKLVGVDVPSQRVPTAPERRNPPLQKTLVLTVEPIQKTKTKEEEDEEAELRALQAEMAI
jgi:charged multivesicular body protein 4